MRTSLQLLAATSLLALGMAAVAAGAVGQQRPERASLRDSARAVLSAQRAVYEYLHLAASPLHPMIRREGQYDFEAFVAEKRDQRPFVMAQLDRLGEWSVRDEWIVGQRVMLRVEHGLLEEALRVALECRATGWWCRELEGFVLHQLGETEAAERAFGAALETIPAIERCFARDLLFLADEPLRAQYAPETDATLRYRFDPRRGYRETGCQEWAEVEARFWWLADPLYLRPGNDRYTEHRSRVVGTWLMAQLQMAITERSTMPGRPVYRGMSYSWLQVPMWEQAVRGGWTPRSYIAQGWPPASGKPSYGFDPGAEVLEDPLGVEAGGWRITSPTTPGRYAPAYGPVAELDPQVAFFRRGDSLRVAVAVDTEGYDTGIGARDSLLAGVVLARGVGQDAVVQSGRGLGAWHRFEAVVADQRYLVSVEVLGDRGGAGRARFGWGLGGHGASGLGMSDMVVFEGGKEVPADLDAVVGRMLGSPRVGGAKLLGVYWEVYGLDEGEGARVSVRLHPEGEGWWRRMAEGLRLRRGRGGIEMSWEEDGAQRRGGAWEGNVLELDLSRLAGGRYELEVRVEARGESMRVRRRLDLAS